MYSFRKQEKLQDFSVNKGLISTKNMYCRLCESDEIHSKQIACIAKKYKGKALKFIFCNNCGFIAAPENTHIYKSREDFGKTSQIGTRVGDGKKPGREYFMTKMGQEILGAEVDVLYFGPGLSKDHEKAKEISGVKRTTITDLINHQNSPNFIPLNSADKYQLVIACEVVEHFEQPKQEFARLLDFLTWDGLAICSTNINDGTPVERLIYPFVTGHVAYYSGSSIEQIAKENGCYFSFALPSVALGEAGPRKRYILFYRHLDIGRKISRFFANNPFAYSESL